jgi:hypothetical protein
MIEERRVTYAELAKKGKMKQCHTKSKGFKPSEVIGR